MSKKTKKDKEYIELDLAKIFKAIWKKIWLVILVTLLSGAVVFSYAELFITPKYEASAMIYVNNNNLSVGGSSLSISSSDLTAAKSLVNTYMVILNSRTVLNQVITESGVDYTYKQLKSMISAAPVKSTEVFEVTVTSKSPEEAEKIANTICEVLPDKIADVIESSSARIVDYAVTPTSKSSPSTIRMSALGMLAGFIAVCIFIAILSLNDQIIREEAYLTDNFNYPILASIPDIDQKNVNKDKYFYKGKE